MTARNTDTSNAIILEEDDLDTMTGGRTEEGKTIIGGFKSMSGMDTGTELFEATATRKLSSFTS